MIAKYRNIITLLMSLVFTSVQAQLDVGGVDLLDVPPDSTLDITVTDTSQTTAEDTLRAVLPDSGVTDPGTTLDAAFPDSVLTVPGDTVRTATTDSLLPPPFIEPILFGLYADSTILDGSAYGSFADVLDEMPVTYFQNRGSVGQKALSSLFAGLPGRYQLDYNGLLLNDPVGGEVDLNLIPTQSVAEIDILAVQHRRRLGNRALGNTLQITSRDIASLPIKSRVAYRNGDNGYDEVDARLGIFASQKMRINAGGLIKGYGGTTLFSDYKAQKINTELGRALGRRWSAHYNLLYNKFDLNIPLLENLTAFPDLSYFHRKDARYDHGFSVSRDTTLCAAVQYTSLSRELYGSRRSDLDLVIKARRLEAILQTRLRLGTIHVMAGVDGHTVNCDDGEGEREQRWTAGGFSHIEGDLFSTLNWHLGARICRFEKYGTFFQPELSAVAPLSGDIDLFLWASRWVNPPSFEQRLSRGPIAFGFPDLKPVDCHSLGGGIEWRKERVFLFASIGIQRIKDAIMAEYRVTGDTSLFSFLNQPQYTRGVADISVWLYAVKWMKAAVKTKISSNLEGGNTNFSLPDVYTKAYIELGGVFFSGDLDARIRLGISFISSRSGYSPYFAEIATVTDRLKPVAVPCIQAFFRIRDATLFVALQNPLRQEYELTYGYPMPLSQFRWGFVWRFVD